MEKRRVLKGVLFDFDGTLVDLSTDYRGLREALDELLAPHGLRVGPSILESLARIRRLRRSGIPKDLSGLAYAIVDRHEWKARFAAKPVPGALSMTRRVDRLGLTWGIVSNNGEGIITWCLRKFRFPAPMAIVARGDATGHKPSASVGRLALRVTGLSPAATLFVGDTMVDRVLAENVGLDFWIVPRHPKAAQRHSQMKLMQFIDRGARA